MRILLIEDDPDLGKLLQEYLKIHDFDVDHAATGAEARKFFHSQKYDLISIDVMLPDTNGKELARYFRSENADTPFLFITARNQKADVIEGLKLGAEDYITKPFEPEELILRINIALRKNNPEIKDEQKLGNSTLVRKEMKLITSGKEFKLTAREFELLSYLFNNHNKVVKREELLEKFWGKTIISRGEAWMYSSAGSVNTWERTISSALKPTGVPGWF